MTTPTGCTCVVVAGEFRHLAGFPCPRHPDAPVADQADGPTAAFYRAALQAQDGTLLTADELDALIGLLTSGIARGLDSSRCDPRDILAKLRAQRSRLP